MLKAKIYRLDGKFNFVKEKTRKNGESNGQLFGYGDFGGCWTAGQLLRYSWKLWGLTVQTSYVEDLEAKLKTPGQLLGHP